MARTPLYYAQGLLSWLQPEGEGQGFVGTIQAGYVFSPPMPYGSFEGQLTPVIFIKAFQTHDQYLASMANIMSGTLKISYLDMTPDQQQRSIAEIEQEMDTNYGVLVDRLRADLTWGGLVTSGGRDIARIESITGSMEDRFGKLWVGMDLDLTWKGTKEVISPVVNP